MKGILISWTKSAFIENIDLIREMFSLLFRQYNALGEVLSSNIIYIFKIILKDSKCIEENICNQLSVKR